MQNYRRQKEQCFNAGKAIATRIDNAIKATGKTRESLLQDAAVQLADAIGDSILSIDKMRGRGGKSGIFAELFPMPATTRNSIGFAENNEFYIWSFLSLAAGDIIARATIILNDRFFAPSAPANDSKFVFVKRGDVPPESVKDSKRSFDIIGKSDTIGVFVNYVNLDDLEVLLECDHVVTIERPVTPDEIPDRLVCPACGDVAVKTITRAAFDSNAVHQSPVEC